MLVLAFTFLVVGTLDLLHTLSFKSMPYFFTESSVAKATWFWVIARFIQSLLIFSILLIPDRKLKRDFRVGVFLTGFFLTGMIGFCVIYFENSLPLMMVEGKGTSSLKNGIEYVVSTIQFGSLLITLYQYYLEKSEQKLAMALAFVFLLLTELIFTIYQSVFDLDNFSGHIFKALGFYFILKSFYFSRSNQEKNPNEQEKQNVLREIPGMIFKAVKSENEFTLTFLEGDLPRQLGFKQEEWIRMPLTEVFIPNSGTLNHYCQLSLHLQESIRFEMDSMENTFLISIKPTIEEDDKEAIIGTVIVMTGDHHFRVQRMMEQADKKNVQKIVM